MMIDITAGLALATALITLDCSTDESTTVVRDWAVKLVKALLSDPNRAINIMPAATTRMAKVTILALTLTTIVDLLFLMMVVIRLCILTILNKYGQRCQY